MGEKEAFVISRRRFKALFNGELGYDMALKIDTLVAIVLLMHEQGADVGEWRVLCSVPRCWVALLADPAGHKIIWKPFQI